jgi:hypothetical protein
LISLEIHIKEYKKVGLNSFPKKKNKNKINKKKEKRIKKRNKKKKKE